MLKGASLIGEKVDKQLGPPAVNVEQIFQFLDGVLSVHWCFGIWGCTDVLEMAVHELKMVRGPLKRMDSEPGVSNQQVPNGQISRSFIVHLVLRHCVSRRGGHSCCF